MHTCPETGIYITMLCERGVSMELQVFRDTLSAAGSSFTVQSEIPVETEILISDYLPQVFKIVKCFVKMVVLQKQLQPGRLTLDGYLRCVVYYQGENGQELCQAEQKLPFTKPIELPNQDFSAWSAIIGGETEYLNCRAVNQRRVEVRGAWSISASVFTQLPQEVITAVADCGSQQKQTALKGTRSVAALDKLITADSEFDFEQQPAAVLDISGTAQVKELKIISGKAVAKGEISAHAAYRTAGDDALKEQKIILPFQQILDIDGLAEDCRCFCTVEPTGFTILAASDAENKNRLSASAMLHLRVFRAFEIDAVSDLFSTQFEMQAEKGEICTETLEKEITENGMLEAQILLPEETTGVMACFASLAPLEVLTDGGKNLLRVRGVLTAFTKNSLGEIEASEKGAELMQPLPTAEAAENLHIECWASVENMECTFSAGAAQVSAAIHLEGFALVKHHEKCLTSASAGEPLQPDDPDVALRIYYAHAGEQVFDIARRFHVSPNAMMRANGLSEETLTAAGRLLVPGAG